MSKKILFIDRDGTLVKEPPIDYQLDKFEKLSFLPGVFRNLGAIAHELDFELVMVSNQDGLGSPSFPEADFWPIQHLIVDCFANEGIHFSKIHIDPSLPEELSPNRKPGIGMLKEYFSPEYNLKESFVIGDRITDVQLANNLGAKAIVIQSEKKREHLDQSVAELGLNSVCALHASQWAEVYEFLKLGERSTVVERVTAETQIRVELSLDNLGKSQISTGLGFFDHLLDQLAKHSGCSLKINVTGDLQVDEHHTIEDTALALGEAFRKVLSDKRGMERYGYVLPMDDCLVQVALDFGGRPWIVYDADFKREKVGDFPCEMIFHFFKSFTDEARMNLNIKAVGENEHHKLEGTFKALAKAIKMAIRRDPYFASLPSTKGLL